MTVEVSSFTEHRSSLTYALITAVENYCRQHGLSFDKASLSQMSLPIEDCTAEILIFGVDRWPPDPTNPMADEN